MARHSLKINTYWRWSLQGSCEVRISMQLVEMVNNGANNNKLTTLNSPSCYELSFLSLLVFKRGAFPSPHELFMFVRYLWCNLWRFMTGDMTVFIIS